MEYEDTPEFRQSLNMQGAAKEAILKKLRDRLGMKEKKKDVKPGSNPKVEWHGSEGEHRKQSPGGSVVARLLAKPRVRGSIPDTSRIFHPKITTCKTILRHCDDMMIFPIIIVSGIVAN